MLINWIQRLQPLTASKGWHWLKGTLRMIVRSEPIDTPWLHAPHSIPGSVEARVDCGILTILHNHGLQRESVPLFCQECYKVVVVPSSLDHVHKIAEWQADLGVAGKVGAEQRSYTQRKWGAYFYCRGVEEGRERYKQVREWVDENLCKDVRVFLKRGCTEFEQHLGDSDKWESIEHQEEIEKEFFDVIEYAQVESSQSDVVKDNVWDIWDVWDKGTQDPVTYHEEK